MTPESPSSANAQALRITLDSNPSDAPCCVKIIASDGRDLLIQTDWDFPAIASCFGWSPQRLQVATEQGEEFSSVDCTHPNTDGTVDCKHCGATASQFISDARQYLDDNDGAEAEDPGYFE